jgi:hypothetical protein
LLRAGVADRLADRILGAGSVEQVAERILEGPELGANRHSAGREPGAERLVAQVLDSPGVDQLVARALDSPRVERLVGDALESLGWSGWSCASSRVPRWSAPSARS